eukprot:superscaffoldBa00000039_g700
MLESTFPDTRKRAKRSVGATYTENVDRSVSGEAQQRFVETVQGISNSRAEYRRTGEEAKGSNPRQSEPHLDTSTFALSGDSAHNQAMVHWSGHNSSVILILTKLYDFNLGAVTESSLWRSTDYGSTYTKLNDKVGSRTVLSYLYVCPTNKQKIMMLSDPEVESAVLISSDEGASFEKHLINFNILSLLFHPAQENWILAYSHDSKLYSSMDFGKKWQLVHDNVMPGRFYWAVMGLDRESDVVHIETRIAKGRAQYVKCRAQRCTEANRQYLFPGHVDTNSLVVQDEYVFTQVTKTGRASYFVSYMRESFRRMKLPKYCLPKDMHIISTDEKQVFAAVQEWNQNNTYSLYISDSPGVYFTLSLENLRTSRGPAGNLLVDFYKVEGIHGMYLANKLVDHHIKTFITYNKGQTWALLPAPATDVVGNNIHCILGELCVMGEKQIYMKRRPGNRCMLAQDYSRIYSSEPCLCTAYDFECDYGWERQANGKCSPAFWFNPNGAAKSCSTSQSFLNSTGYRKVLSNNCKEGGKNVYSPRRQACRPRPPRGLRLSTSQGELSAAVGSNVTFMVYLDDGDSLRTSIQLDFGDGIRITYSNLSRTDDGIKHIYRTTGIYRVTASAENSQGSDSSMLFLHITSPVERVYLSAPIVTIRGKEANLTAVVWPSHTRTLTFFWWFDNSSEPIITLEGSISYTFQREGKNKVTVQVASGNAVMQDSKVITVKEFFRSLLLSFSPALDEHNPDIPEWREDIGRVVRTALSQVSGVPEDQLLVSLYPGLPTAAELFILPDEHTSSEHKRRREEALETISDIFVTALNQGLIQFELKADIRIIVYITQQTLAPLVDSNSIHSGSAMLMLLTVVFVGLAAFFIYKFKRKIPWINVQTEDSHEKEPEVISTVGQNDNMSKVKLSEFPSQKELMEKELEARSR